MLETSHILVIFGDCTRCFSVPDRNCNLGLAHETVNNVRQSLLKILFLTHYPDTSESKVVLIHSLFCIQHKNNELYLLLLCETTL